MLSLRKVILGILSIVFCIFVGVSYLYNQNIAIKEARQKIQEAHFALEMGLLSVLNEENIYFFAEGMGVGIFVKKREHFLSSVRESSTQEAKNQLKFEPSPVLKNGFLYQGFENQEGYHVLSYQVKRDFFNPFLFASLMLCVFVFLWILSLVLQSHRFLSSIRNEKKLLGSVLFKEVYFFEKQLERMRKVVLNKELKNIRQAKKIRLKNTQLLNLVSAIAHEIKNPLSVISLALESLENQKLESKDKLIARIQHQVYKLNAITQKLNFVFNLKRDSLSFEVFDLFALSKEVVENYREPRLQISGEKTLVNADIFLIEQVIINLMSNALKYSQANVVIEVKNGEFKITDYGVGIAQSEYKKITKKFYKVYPDQENSFGLGLFIVKKILNFHKTSLKIESIPQKKTTFSFSLTSNLKAL